MVLSQFLIRKKTHFALWRPRFTDPQPALFIGQLLSPSSVDFNQFKAYPLQQSPSFPDLWEIEASACGLIDGQVYYYWFKVSDGIEPSPQTEQVVYVTDPLAYSIDRNISAPVPSEANGITLSLPASLILYKGGELLPTDSTGLAINPENNAYLANLKSNNSTVIYELPTRWVKKGSGKYVRDIGKTIGVGTFRDCLALLNQSTTAPSFTDLDEINQNAHLLDLGANVLELLPPEDSSQESEWGYGTSHYFAPDFDLGRPDNNTQSTAVNDLSTLIQICHNNGIRFYLDAVMAFSVDNPQFHVNFLDFFEFRDTGFGGRRLRYELNDSGNPPQIFDPVTGQNNQGYPFVPARRLMMTHISHWIHFYHIDGIRIDNVSGIDNWNFLLEFTRHSRSEWQDRGGADNRFIVIGEELGVPTDLIRQNRVDSLWNENFKKILRRVILGQNAGNLNEPSFEWSVRKLIDCRLLGFSDGAQAINYIGSHDVGGSENERFYNYLDNNHVYDKLKRFKLAFVCLMTAVGIPMIFAGDEFADQHDLPLHDPVRDPKDRNKQMDPVNFNRKSDPWRKELFEYVSRLVKFRIASESLSVNETEFIHVDFSQGKRVLVWRRGRLNSVHPVVVVANFSDWGSDTRNPSAEYRIPNWPDVPDPNKWIEVTQDRKVDPDWVGREPIYPWEAKVYTLM
jgi:1,4-alpha-glucan branching enzyme